MPGAIPFISTAVSAFFANTAAVITGGNIALDAAISTAAYYGTAVVTTLAINAGLTALTTPGVPKPEAQKQTFKSTIPDRQSGYGIARISGPVMFREALDGKLYRVVAIHDGQIDSILSYYLHDDPVTLSGGGVIPLANGNYGDSTAWVRIDYRLGLPTETYYSEINTAFPGLWDSTHRGDGVASLYEKDTSPKLVNFSKTFPNGAPEPSVVAKLQLVYDWRDVGQDPDDETTWLWSANPIVCLSHFLTHPDRGMGFDWHARIEPNLASWTAEADICDVAVALAAGGTVPRYACGGVYQHSNAPSAVIQNLLDCCDGWLTQDGSGCFVVRAGAYAAPTVTFTDDDIIDYSLQRFIEDEQATNVLIVSYTSPDHKYSTVETDPWRDEADITARGIERSSGLELPWVQNNSQARRLAKRKMSRIGAAVGSIRVGLVGFDGLGERYIRIQMQEIGFLNDIVAEVTRVEIDLASLSVTFEWVVADPNIDVWDEATEEANGPAGETRPPGADLVAPAITDGLLLVEAGGRRIQVTATGPDRVDLAWLIQWREVGGTAWIPALATDIDPGDAVILETGFVTSETDVEVQVAYQIGSGDQSPWSATQTISTTYGVAPLKAGTVNWINRLVSTDAGSGRLNFSGTGTPAGAVADGALDASFPVAVTIKYPTQANSSTIVTYLDDVSTASFSWPRSVGVVGVYHFGGSVIQRVGSTDTTIGTAADNMWLRLTKSGNDIVIEQSTNSGGSWSTLSTATGVLTGKTSVWLKALAAVPSASKTVTVVSAAQP